MAAGLPQGFLGTQSVHRVLQTQLRPLRRHQPPELVQDVKEAYEDEVTAKEERDTSEKDVRDRAAAGLVSMLCQILV